MWLKFPLFTTIYYETTIDCFKSLFKTGIRRCLLGHLLKSYYHFIDILSYYVTVNWLENVLEVNLLYYLVRISDVTLTTYPAYKYRSTVLFLM